VTQDSSVDTTRHRDKFSEYLQVKHQEWNPGQQVEERELSLCAMSPPMLVDQWSNVSRSMGTTYSP